MLKEVRCNLLDQQTKLHPDYKNLTKNSFMSWYLILEGFFVLSLFGFKIVVIDAFSRIDKKDDLNNDKG